LIQPSARVNPVKLGKFTNLSNRPSDGTLAGYAPPKVFLTLPLIGHSCLDGNRFHRFIRHFDPLPCIVKPKPDCAHDKILRF